MATSSPLSPAAAPPAASLRLSEAALGRLCMVGSGLLLGTLGLFVVRAGQDPLTTIWYRCLFGGLFLSAWLTLTRQWALLRLPRGVLARAAATGLLMIVSWALFFAALSHIAIGTATLVVHVQPLWVMLLGALCLGERIAPRQWACMGFALVGLALASGVGEALHDAAGAWLGIGLCLASSLCYGAAPLVAKTASAARPLAMAWVQCVLGVVLLAAWAPAHTAMATPAAWGWLIGLGVLHTGLSYVLVYAGTARLPAAQIALLNFVYPATALVVDALAFDRPFTPVQGLGAALMAAALLAAARLKARPAV